VTEPSPPDFRIALRLARLVARVAQEPAVAAEHRRDVRALAKALKKGRAELVVAPDGSLRDGELAIAAPDAEDAETVALLGARLAAYGVERVVLADSATEADLFDLVKLLATTPDQADPLAFFAARAAAIDARAIPRSLRSAPLAGAEEPPSAPEPPSVREPASVKEPASAKEPASVKEPASAPPASEATDKRSDRLTEALELPQTTDAELASLFTALQETEATEHLRDPLERLTVRADQSFRSGDFDTMMTAMAGLVAIEHAQLERDASDERRREFARAARTLATPVLLRQLAAMRHRRAGDPTALRQLQAILHRYGTDGAEALIDEWANVATPEARATCLEALRGLRRTHDALFELVRDTDHARVRQGIAVLGALGDARAEQLVLEQLRHPDASVRRDVVAALERFSSTAALDAIGVALLDEEPVVRLRAIAALVPRGQVAVKLLAPVLDGEADPEVLFAAIAALGRIGGADAVQLLIRAVNGETQHPRRRGASYRLQACAALAQIRTPQAMAAVQLLRDDRDREVREGAMRLVAQAARRGTTAARAMVDA
jgi:hypothetical protein